MKQQLHHDANHPLEPHHTKPWRLAEKFEGYLGVAMVVAALVLLAILAYGVMNTGAGTPSWMR
jgi:hypothetical protein